jgi:hypothetical protein
MRRVALVPLALIALVVVAAQLFLPGIAERRAEHRLERGGGTATVSVSALPAMRLLFGDGDSLTVRGSGLRVEPEQRGDTLDRVDGFSKVSLRLDHLTAGPLDIGKFRLDRKDGERDYRTRMSATTTASKVGSFLGSQAGGPLGGLLGGLAGGSLPAGGAEVPLHLDAVIASRDGNVQVRSARGSVAGIPAGPLAGLVVAAVASRF